MAKRNCIDCKYCRLDRGTGWYCTIKKYDPELLNEEQLEEAQVQFLNKRLYFVSADGDNLPEEPQLPCELLLGYNYFKDKER